ncbi:MAG: GNAT family N-acetyltransferase [Rhodobacteraceae bacterium]|nr:GNAT family N-acetyltransferase [Paracoccaceae bacterium]
MTPPSPAPSLADVLFPAIAATWPAGRSYGFGGWTINQTHGAGNRTSAATWEGAKTGPDADGIDAAADEMRRLGQVPLFMLRGTAEVALDSRLEGLGYTKQDATVIYAHACAGIAAPPPPVTCFEVWPPLAVQAELWEQGGIGAARLAVMHRVAGAKTSLFGRIDDTPAGTAFVALHGPVAMLHALEVAEEHRRKGMARIMVAAAADWALRGGAKTLTLLTTRANLPAGQLYASLGFCAVGHYHYRIKPEDPCAGTARQTRTQPR